MPATHESAFKAFHFLALDAVASSRATGCKPRKSEIKRAEAVIARLGL